MHDRAAHAVRCLTCHGAATQVIRDDAATEAEPAEPIDLGDAGESARRKHARRRANREQRIDEQWGRFSGVAKRLSPEPRSERAWRKGADGEADVAERLGRRLHDAGVVVMHDRRIPGSRANIDHIAVGPGGVTVIDAKNLHGKIRVEGRGGLFTPRTKDLLVAGRRRTKLVDGMKRQMELVTATLASELPGVDVRGALCMADVDGLPMLRHLEIDGIAIDGPRHIAKLAARPGDPPIDVDAVARLLAERFPRA
jgi:hypothetical protein